MNTHGRRVTFEGLSGWFALGANIVTIAGLIVVVVELNQNQKVQRAQARHELSTAIVNVLMESANNQQLSDVIDRAARGAQLTSPERLQFEMRTNAIFRYWEDVHYQYRMGLYDEEEFDRQREAWSVTLRGSQGMRDYWCRVRTLYSPSFASELDRLLPPESCAGKKTRS